MQTVGRRVTSAALEEATEHQGRARVALSAALEHGPSHAYLFRGPRGAGKRAAARAFAAEIVAEGAADPEDARRRALLDPSPHPDLVWLAPRGAQHMVDEVRERVIRAAAYRPFEGEHRVFVIDAAEAMRDESQNALLKTLEEPPSFVHLILLSSEPDGLLETIASRCQRVDFAPLPAEVLEADLASAPEAAGAAPEEIAAAAHLAAGDLERARLLLSPTGRELRAEVEACLAATIADELSGAPWQKLLERATAAGEEAEGDARAALEEESQAGIKRTAKDIGDGAKRAGRRRRTEILDLGLELCALWLRDLAAIGIGAEEVVFDRDRLGLLRAQASESDPGWARRGAAAVQDTRRGLDLNVSEELALEALFYKLARSI
jgi:DNA polymerase III subunit delta'